MQAEIDFDFLKKSSKFFSLIITVLVIVIVFFILCSSLLVYVKPNEYGIKQVNIGLFKKQGIEKKVYNTGYHIVIPFIERMHKFPKQLLVLALTNYPKYHKNIKKRFLTAAHIQTSDGFFVDVDVTILYKIVSPYLVITKIGPGKLYEDNGIIPKAEPTLKSTLGELTVEDFYNSHKRVEKMYLAEKRLKKELEPKGIEIVKVLIRYFKYSKEIQENIEDKKLKDQLVYKNKAEAAAAKTNAELERTIQAGKANVEVRLAKGKAYVTKKQSEMELYYRKRIAEADLKVELAKAKALELKNQALKGIGSELMVALEMAKVYKGLDLIVLPSTGKGGLNPLDLDDLLKLSGVNFNK